MPATTPGNAVNAKWVGPDGMQLWDGTILHKGDVVLDVGYDEAKGSDYWEIVSSVPKDTDAPSASDLRNDWSFGVEEGGGATGRPELDGGAAVEAPATLSPTPGPTTDSKADDKKADS